MKATQRMLGAIAALSLALAGCAGSQAEQDASAGGGQSGDGLAPTELPDPGQPDDGDEPADELGADEHGAGALSADRLEASQLPEGYPREVSLAEDGETLIITAMEANGCITAEAEATEQTGDEVDILLRHTETSDAGAMCTQMVTYPEVDVALDEPLGERTVVLYYERR